MTRNENTKAYNELKALLVSWGWNERDAALEAYTRLWPARGSK